MHTILSNKRIQQPEKPIFNRDKRGDRVAAYIRDEMRDIADDLLRGVQESLGSDRDRRRKKRGGNFPENIPTFDVQSPDAPGSKARCDDKDL